MTNIAGAAAIRHFAGANRPGGPGFRKGWQKHHLLPRQLYAQRCFAVMLSSVGPAGICLDDFDSNGLLLPGSESAAAREGLPLHRGPHKVYNELVFERVGAIEMEWSRIRRRDESEARSGAVARLALVQRALSRRLKGEGQSRVILNRSDPIGTGIDFATLDAMADQLWSATAAS